ncbi:AgrD family cyclic lactone autoinducer peptide [uncultured Eubacterium sp.]|nr:cyclic lactone autoinducer peptide [uncultured Eubacterium sp.]
MKNNFVKTALKNAAVIATKNSSNSTASGTIYQPKAPALLKKFSKIKK